MKSILVFCSLFFLYFSPIKVISQDFTSKVKDNATVIFTMNGDNLLDKVSEDKINVSQLFYEMKREFRVKELQKLSDLGFNFNASMVYAMELDTNMITNLFFMSIEDIKKFENLMSKTQGGRETIIKNGFKWITNKYNSEHVVWNNEFAVFAFGSYIGQQYGYDYSYGKVEYDYSKENRAIDHVIKLDTGNNWTLKQKSDKVDELLKSKLKLSDYENNPKAFLEEDGTGYLKDQEEKIEMATDQVMEDIAVDNVVADLPPPPPPAPKVERIYEEEIIEEVTEVVEVERRVGRSYSNRRRNYNNDYYKVKREIRNYRERIRNNIQSDRKEVREEKRRIFINSLFNNRFDLIFNKDISNSINRVKNFTSSRDKKADAILWMRNNYIQNSLRSMYSSMLGYGYWGRGYRRNGLLGNALYQFGEDISITKMYFEKKRIRFTQSGIQSKQGKETTNQIFSTKQDSRFYKYINGSNFVGYISSSINSAAAIKQMPSMWMQSIAMYEPKMTEEFNVLAEVLEVFIDEEALGKIATGNAFFVFKDMKQKEVKYMGYEYDENYRRLRVEKSRMEYQPEFMLMLTTENQSLLKRVLALGIKNGVISKDGNYYSTINKRSRFPLDMFLTMRDGIVFITTDETEAKTISAGGTFSGLSKTHKKLASKNSQVVYFDNKKLMSYFPETSVRRRNRNNFNYYKENGFEEVLITTKNNKGSLFSEGYMNVPEGKDNSAEYLFEFINQMMMR